MKTKIAIVSVPFILSKTHFNLAKSTLLSLLSNKHDYDLNIITVINHFESSEEDLDWLKKISNDLTFNDKNVLARAWNIGINKALRAEADFVLVTNLDVFFRDDFLHNLVSFAQQNPEPLIWGGISSTPFEPINENVFPATTSAAVHFSCFLCNNRLFREVGEFDEAFSPAYHEDTDMTYRISIAGHSILSTSNARYQHLDRGTLKGATESGKHEFVLAMHQHLDSSLQYYCKKWGGPPGQETFTKPFGS